MGPMCPMQNGGGFRGPPIPLVVVPVIYHLVQSNPDLKLTQYVKDLLNKGGPVSVAENAHHIVQCKCVSFTLLHECMIIPDSARY